MGDEKMKLQLQKEKGEKQTNEVLRKKELKERKAKRKKKVKAHLLPRAIDRRCPEPRQI
ncbi:hypothetical protein CCACVL1_05329 [Corchorus capsularis]|uniref:Uncharacterized protein n=1 Tax=Corchorus capsularis TaxID=210143 RepID=A0A1R3JLH1_COCAP|nr:hypothetical protein CCACVL1_05329 [Corchorus capsularis]